MRATIFVTGLVILTICVFVSLASLGEPKFTQTPVHPGYFVVVAASFLATALYREGTSVNPKLKYAVYRRLASESLSFDDLITKVRDNDLEARFIPPDRDLFETVIAVMLEEGRIEVKNGLLHLAPSTKNPEDIS